MMVCLDTNMIIYYVEPDSVWKPKVDGRFRALASNGDTLATSEAARMECLVGLFRSGNTAVLADYQTFFSLPGIQMLPVTPAVWERAAHIRATYKFQALDSIHLATAIEHGCGLFLTNDTQLAHCRAIAVEVLT